MGTQEFKASLGSIARPYLKNKQVKEAPLIILTQTELGT
jgi:hypothetical protein